MDYIETKSHIIETIRVISGGLNHYVYRITKLNGESVALIPTANVNLSWLLKQYNK